MAVCRDPRDRRAAVVRSPLWHLGEIFDPKSCVIYFADGDSYVPVFSSINGSAPILADAPALSNSLASKIAPVELDERGKRHSALEPALAAVADLEALDAALLVPLRPGGEASAFLCLGTKHSGDVYTATDLALRSSVGHVASAALTQMRGD